VKNSSFVDSLNNAVEGFVYVIKTQRNMRTHFLLGILALIAGIYFNLNRIEMLFLCGTISLVLVAEMINTAMELTVDLIKDEFHPLAMIIKDVSAGAVFLAALNSLIMGYVIFARHVTFKVEDGIHTIKESPWQFTLVSLLLIVFLVIVVKVFSKKGTPFRGGMPSGHAAFAFSVWTIITLLTETGLVSVLTFIMAVIIARHRVQTRVHTFWEVLAGALLGMFTTLLVFQCLRS